MLRVLAVGAEALRGDSSRSIRPTRPSDEPRVRRFFERLSPHTRYQRFLSAVPGVPETLLRHLIAAGDTTRVSLIAEVHQEHTTELVGVANLVAMDDRRAEAALVVADAWQDQGIGLELARALMEEGKRLGVERFVVHTQWHNPAVRALLARTADVVRSEMHSDIVEITLVPRGR